MLVFKEPRELFDYAQRSRGLGATIGLIPTMGALHRGHLAIVKRAREECDLVCVSVFVNPLQFNNQSDFDRYPRNLEADSRLLESVGVDILFSPALGDIHPSPSRMRISVGEMSALLEGQFRPGHFDGVALVVAKLFLAIGPCVAYFGEKDFQQLRVITDLVREFHFPVEVRPIKTIREADGLALSSRNQLLSKEARLSSTSIFEAFEHGKRSATLGKDPEMVLEEMVAIILETAQAMGSTVSIDYLELVESGSLRVIRTFEPTSRFFCAASFDGVRLIDNVAVFE